MKILYTSLFIRISTVVILTLFPLSLIADDLLSSFGSDTQQTTTTTQDTTATPQPTTTTSTEPPKTSAIQPTTEASTNTNNQNLAITNTVQPQNTENTQPTADSQENTSSLPNAASGLIPTYATPLKNDQKLNTITNTKLYDVPKFQNSTTNQFYEEKPDYESLVEIASGNREVGDKVSEIAREYPIQILSTGGNTGTGFVYAQAVCMYLNSAISFLLRSCVAVPVDNVNATGNLLSPTGKASMLITREDYWAAAVQKTGPLYNRPDLRLVSFLNYDTITVFANKKTNINSIATLKNKINNGNIIKIAILRPTDSEYIQDFIASISASAATFSVVTISEREFEQRFCSEDRNIDMVFTVGGAPDFITAAFRGKCDSDIVPIAFTPEDVLTIQKANPFYAPVRLAETLYSRATWKNIPLSLANKSKFYTIGIRQVLLAPANEDPILIFHTIRSFVKIFPDIRISMPTYDLIYMNTEDLLKDSLFNPRGLYHNGLYNYMFIHNDFFSGMGFLTLNDFKFYNLISTINPNSPKVTFDGQIVMVENPTTNAPQQNKTGSSSNPTPSAPLPYLQPNSK